MEGEQSHENHPPSMVAEGDDHHIITKKQGPTFCQFQGFWCRSSFVPNIISFQKHFQALDDDIIVASKPKAGTTWLKALVFTIVNRARFSLSNSPLNLTNPHKLIPYLEITVYGQDHIPDLTSIPSPRLFATHLPFAVLAESSIKQAKSRIVYVTRNPLDIIVSFWHFIRGIECPDWPLEECFEMFCRGKEGFGPFWDHALGYWKESSEKPHKVLFLKYEHLKENPIQQIKRIAEFIGFPFSVEEERAGAIEEIKTFCSFSNMKDLVGNMTGTMGRLHIQPKELFRKGEVGDHINYLSPSAIERFCKIVEEKLSGSGLAYDLPC
ncbi:Sulfotransferase domain - like 8 [Theobroma cacao]|nr:Sulfotransferase domain - like 8 [Theobroma cacao]